MKKATSLPGTFLAVFALLSSSWVSHCLGVTGTEEEDFVSLCSAQIFLHGRHPFFLPPESEGDEESRRENLPSVLFRHLDLFCDELHCSEFLKNDILLLHSTCLQLDKDINKTLYTNTNIESTKEDSFNENNNNYENNHNDDNNNNNYSILNHIDGGNTFMAKKEGISRHVRVLPLEGEGSDVRIIRRHDHLRDEDPIFATADKVETQRIEGLCVTTVSCADSHRIHVRSLDELEEKLLLLHEEREVPISKLPAIREYVKSSCFSNEKKRRLKTREFPNLEECVDNETVVSDDAASFRSQLTRAARRGKKATNSKQILKAVKRRMQRSFSRLGSNGLLLLPAHKLAVCVPPKAGVVSVMFLLLAILGNLPEEICGCEGSRKFGCLGIEALRDYSHPMFRGLVYLDDAIRFAATAEERARSEEWLELAFTSEQWTSIMFARDPWRRAISAFHEDNGYQDWLNLSTTLQRSDVSMRRAMFLRYLRQHGLNHGMPASLYCHLPEGLVFDHVVDIDRGLSSLASLLGSTVPPVPLEALQTGWESCTAKGEASVLQARLRTTHTWSESPQQLDEVYCSAEVVQAVMRHFREDYRHIVPRLNISYLPKCLEDQDAIDWLLSAEL